MLSAETINLFFSFSPLLWGIALLLAGIFTFLAYRITNPPISGGKRVLLTVLRFIAFLAIILMILEPLLAWVMARPVQPRVAIMWDNSRSMSISDKSGSRDAIVRELYDSEPLLKIRREFPVDEFAFADTLIPVNNGFSFDGEATAMGKAIFLLQKGYSTGDPLGAVIIISDGQANYGEDPLGAAYRSEFPIYTVGVGDPTPPRDIILRQLTTQKVAYVGQDFPIIAGIRALGYGGREATARLYADGEKIDEKRVILSERGELVDITFTVSPDTDGVFTYRVLVPALEGELTPANNARSVRVNILPSKNRILVIAAQPTWESTFYLRAVRSDPDLIVENAFTGKSSPAGSVRLPTTLAGFQEYDAVAIIGG
ncbi:hypothetical protein DRQ36_08595, partial [bacterium]